MADMDSPRSASDRNDNGGYTSGGGKSDDGSLSWGFSSFRGKRATMEDFYDIKSSMIASQPVSIFGIFDGHGGSRAAEFLKEILFENLMKHPLFLTDTKLAISETYQKTDADFLDAESNILRDDGSTAAAAVFVGNHLYVANVGDSRAVISKAGQAIQLSDDHKPNRIDERRRIENAGGVVMWAGTWRVGGVLAMSRAFGNRLLKRFVVAEPEIQDTLVDEEFELLVIASDGLWDVVTNEDVVALARLEDDQEVAARKLTETAFSRGSADNITVIVVRYHHNDTTLLDSPPDVVNADSPPAVVNADYPPAVVNADYPPAVVNADYPPAVVDADSPPQASVDCPPCTVDPPSTVDLPMPKNVDHPPGEKKRKPSSPEA